MPRSRHRLLSVIVGTVAFVISLRHSLRADTAKRRQLGPGRPTRPAPPLAGREARSPEEIPVEGWWQIAKRTAKKFSDNELLSEAASVTFFALLSLFPAITAIVSIYGLFANPATIGEHLEVANGFVPSGGMEIVREQVKRLTASPAGGLSAGRS